MTRDTSEEAFNKIKPFLGNRQKLIYSFFKKYGACTNLEISTWQKIPINQVTPRTNELYKKGYLTIAQKRICSISGRTALSWRIKNG